MSGWRRLLPPVLEVLLSCCGSAFRSPPPLPRRSFPSELRIPTTPGRDGAACRGARGGRDVAAHRRGPASTRAGPPRLSSPPRLHGLCSPVLLRREPGDGWRGDGRLGDDDHGRDDRGRNPARATEPRRKKSGFAPSARFQRTEPTRILHEYSLWDEPDPRCSPSKHPQKWVRPIRVGLVPPTKQTGRDRITGEPESAMARPRATTTAAPSKPKPKSRFRATKPKATPSPVSLLSGVSSPSACRTPSPAAADLGFRLSPSSPPAKPGTRNSSPLASPAAMSTIGDLRSLTASHLDSLKRRFDALHGEYVRDLEASHSRISKRVKMQSHGCVQLAEEVDKEQKKMADKIAEHAELVKTSYKKFVAEVQASTSRVCKVTVPEMAKSVERAIDGLRSCYNISTTPSA